MAGQQAIQVAHESMRDNNWPVALCQGHHVYVGFIQVNCLNRSSVCCIGGRYPRIKNGGRFGAAQRAALNGIRRPDMINAHVLGETLALIWRKRLVFAQFVSQFFDLVEFCI